jgi:hypothetical protein
MDFESDPYLYERQPSAEGLPCEFFAQRPEPLLIFLSLGMVGGKFNGVTEQQKGAIVI